MTTRTHRGRMPETSIAAVIARKQQVAAQVWRFEFAAADGAVLPPYTAGAHVDVWCPNGARRSYSLVDAPGESPRYAISVLRQPGGRGGSLSLIDDAHEGDRINITSPINTFPLEASASYLLVAGGIGITAIRSMHRALREEGHPRVRVLYLARSRSEAAYVEEFEDSGDASAVVHHSRDTGTRLDLWPYLAEPNDTQIYCCGSAALMDEVSALTAHWNPRSIHFEDFVGVAARQKGDSEFRLIWRPTGTTLNVPADTTALDAIRSAGIYVDSSCQAGTCGTCRLTLFSGDADHRDAVLTEDERASGFMPCVSRAAADFIEIGP
ncbi:PDR/VanB family oxidoreductase [Gryllotalpicola protaetiae]|uniref:Oxidoreductase n=1 Tax=Gryllotalpicola protaetiae TaxID=2419771 RepID=A0A387BLZ5_9MICO|nr:PDR/VanB family oxidoreductase [Gryllotalpicola protaetiae]AYG02219.1 oxidoreductase [Gryllotalpicola protaetiae]